MAATLKLKLRHSFIHAEAGARGHENMPAAKATVTAAAAAAAMPCSACKLLRRRCSRECVFGPYFPAKDPQRFACVHRVFGASNVSKMLQELPMERRADAVNSMVYEARSRLADPVYGCVAVVSALQARVAHLQTQLALTQAHIHILVSAFNAQQQPVLPFLQHLPCDNATPHSDPHPHPHRLLRL